VFAAELASTNKLATVLLPRLESGNDGAPVRGMMFFNDIICCLRKGDPIGEQLSAVANEHRTLAHRL